MLFARNTVPMYAVLVMLLFCSACSQRWHFAPTGPQGHLANRPIEPNRSDNLERSPIAPNQGPAQMAAADHRSLPPYAAPTTPPIASRPSVPPPQQNYAVAQQPWQQAPTRPYYAAQPQFAPQPSVPPSKNAPFTLYPQPTDPNVASPSLNPPVDRELGAPSAESSYMDRPFFSPRSFCQDVRSDYGNYYNWRSARGYLYTISGASFLANTSLDDDFRDWYQRDARSEGSDNFSNFWKTFGEGKYIVPAFACLAVAGKALDKFPVADTVGEHGYRTTRAYLVGAPPMIFSQYLLGGSRPTEVPHESMWRPFDDNNGVSGHSFIGAVPFITAAQMSENRLMKAGFYTLSTFPAWSRVNDDAHFLSQVCLGWYMAYMACRSVNETSDPNRRFEVLPICEPGGAGIMAIWKR